jgi:membrane dipeptidase
VVNFTTPFNAVRDTIEQIDIARLIIDKHKDTFELSRNSWDWRRAIHKKKIGGMIGIE